MECSTKRSTQWWKPTPPKQTWRQMSPKNATLDEFSFEHTRFGVSGSLWPKHSSKCGSDPPFRSKILPRESYSFGFRVVQQNGIHLLNEKLIILRCISCQMVIPSQPTTLIKHLPEATRSRKMYWLLMKRMIISLLYCCIPFSVPFPAPGLNQHVLPFCLVQWK